MLVKKSVEALHLKAVHLLDGPAVSALDVREKKFGSCMYVYIYVLCVINFIPNFHRMGQVHTATGITQYLMACNILFFSVPRRQMEGAC